MFPHEYDEILLSLHQTAATVDKENKFLKSGSLFILLAKIPSMVHDYFALRKHKVDRPGFQCDHVFYFVFFCFLVKRQYLPQLITGHQNLCY